MANCFQKAELILKNEQADSLDEEDAWDDSKGITFDEYITLHEKQTILGIFQIKTF